MLRKATMGDLDAMIALRCASSNFSRQEAEGWLLRVAGLDNIFLLQQHSVVYAMLAAVPVQYGYRSGIWFAGMAVRSDHPAPEDTMRRFIEICMRAFAASGCAFAVLVPESEKIARAAAALGYRGLLPLRVLRKPIERNLLAQAEFDSLTVSHLLELRLQYQPGCITLPDKAMEETMTQLYRRGVTVVSNRRGYGLFYQQADTLQFIELQADNDHYADLLLQAAREKTGAETAHILLAENQSLYLGAGRRSGYGMMAFLQKSFPTPDAYFRILL